MADSKVSALTSATSVGGSDLLYLIQSNTSKKITAGTLFANAGNVTLSGNINIGGTPQTLSSPGLVSLTTPITHLTADATGGTLQLPQGTNGQLKILSLISTSGGSYAINPANIAASANIVLNSSGDSVWLLFTNNKWYVIGDKQSDVVTSVNGSTGSVTLTTSNINESGNLYYTNARVYSNVSQIGYLTAASLAGYATNSQLSAYATTAQLGVYATNAQISGFATTGSLTTANVSEVTNLYFTNTRAVGALTAGNQIIINSNGLISANVTPGLTDSSVATLTNKTFDVSFGSNNIFSIQGQSLASYTGSGQNVVLSQSPTINVLNISDSQMNFDGGSGTLYWSGQSGVSQAGDLKAGVYASDPASNNSLFTFATNGSNYMSVGVEGSLFVGTALPSNNGGLNTTFPGWLVVQSGGKFGGTINTLGALQFDDAVTGKIIFADGTTQNTAFTTNILTTANVVETSNLYFTPTRTINALAGNTVSIGDLTVTSKSKFVKVVESFTSIPDATGVVVHNCANSHIFNHTSIDNNFTANFTNLNLNDGEATSLTLILNQGGTAYIANAVQIGGVSQTIKWQANAQPTGNVNAIDIQTFSVLNVSGNYTVLGQLTTFG